MYQQQICFVEKAGEKYRLLLATPAGYWLISYENPAPPFFVSPDELKGYKRISTPKPFLAAMQRRRTKAQNLRYHLIAPLINEAQNIHDKAHRHKAAANIAAANHTTPKRILRLYYRYMATGSLML